MDDSLFPIPNETPLIPELKAVQEWAPSTHRALLHELSVSWAVDEWKRRFGELECIILWSSGECANRLALRRVKVGRKLGSTGYYLGFEAIPCSVSIPVNWRDYSGKNLVAPSGSSGAFIFTFDIDGKKIPILYVSLVYHDLNGNPHYCPITLCPPAALRSYDIFEKLCIKATRQIERRPDVQIIGGTEGSFKPHVNWEDVILAESLKADIKREMESFFATGIGLYRELNLPPFRKILLVGPPGAGKTMLCAALAKRALQRRIFVIYVSASDAYGAAFHKIHQALQMAAMAKFPTLLIVEELDAYLRADDKSQILNVLDGMEAPNNPRGVLMLSTTNYPEIIDERIAKRPGRVDRILYIPPIQDDIQAEQMLIHYMRNAYQPQHAEVIHRLIGKTGAFVREVSVHARMLALNDGHTEVSLNMLQDTIIRLETQLGTSMDYYA